MPRRPVLTEEEIRAEFARIKGSGLKLLSAYPTKAEYYYWRRLFTDLNLCGHQCRADRLVRARKYCVNWRLKNKEKLFSIRKEKSEVARKAREEAKAQKRLELEQCRKALMTTKALTKSASLASPTASSALGCTRTKKSRKSAAANVGVSGSAGLESTQLNDLTPSPQKPLTSS